MEKTNMKLMHISIATVIVAVIFYIIGSKYPGVSSKLAGMVGK